MTEMARRVEHPVDVTLPVRVTTRTQALPGTTVNMSRSGMLVTIDRDHSLEGLIVDETLVLEVELPPRDGRPRRCIECRARVTRIAANENGELALSLEVEQMQISDYEEAKQFAAEISEDHGLVM